MPTGIDWKIGFGLPGVLGLQTRSLTDLIARGHRGIIRSMEQRPGAIVIDPKRGPNQRAWSLRALQFYHPSLAYLAPFIGLLMIRSNVICNAFCRLSGRLVNVF